MIEGRTQLFADGNEGAGPGARSDRPFYNPAMQPNRDLSVDLVQAYARRRGRQIDVADVLAGTGARSLRLGNEVDADILVHANDADPGAIAAIDAGIDANGLSNVHTTHQPARRFLAERRFDVVDIDPFGSPMPFLDAALQATRHDGLLCLTATDTGALCGTYPKACRRRYGAEPLHASPWRAEVGLRILAAAAIRAAGRTDRAAQPVLAIARGHWMRVVLQVRDDRAAADRAARSIRGVGEHPATRQAVEGDAGPMWWGDLQDEGLLSAMTSPLAQQLLGEACLDPGWIPLAHLPKRLGGTSVPKRKDFLAALAATGHHGIVSHIDPHGIKTDAPPPVVAEVWRSLL